MKKKVTTQRPTPPTPQTLIENACLEAIRIRKGDPEHETVTALVHTLANLIGSDEDSINKAGEELTAFVSRLEGQLSLDYEHHLAEFMESATDPDGPDYDAAFTARLERRGFDRDKWLRGDLGRPLNPGVPSHE